MVRLETIEDFSVVIRITIFQTSYVFDNCFETYQTDYSRKNWTIFKLKKMLDRFV